MIDGHTTMTVPMSEVQGEDFLPGLDNGYVIDVDHDPDIRDGKYNVGIASGMVAVSFNTADGDEAYVIAPPDMPVTVERKD